MLSSIDKLLKILTLEAQQFKFTDPRHHWWDRKILACLAA